MALTLGVLLILAGVIAKVLARIFIRPGSRLDRVRIATSVVQDVGVAVLLGATGVAAVQDGHDTLHLVFAGFCFLVAVLALWIAALLSWGYFQLPALRRE